MAQFKKVMVREFCGLILSVLRLGLIPRTLAYMVIGGALWALGGTGDVASPILCYEFVPEDARPAVKHLSITPNPTGGADKVRVEATVVNYYSGQISGAYVLMDKPDYKNAVGGLPGRSMQAADGAFDSDSEEAYLDLDVSEFPVGTTRIYVVGWDREGGWGRLDSVDLEVTE